MSTCRSLCSRSTNIARGALYRSGYGRYRQDFHAQTTGLYVASHSALRTNSEGSKLVFHRFGDTYFLSAVWVTGNKTGRELFPGRAERELTDRKVEMELAVVHPEKLHPAK